MQEGLRRLYRGDFNYMSQERQPDGSVIITLAKEGEAQIYRFKVKNLYGENEEVLKHEVIETKSPKWALDRMEKAKKGKEVIGA